MVLINCIEKSRLLSESEEDLMRMLSIKYSYRRHDSGHEKGIVEEPNVIVRLSFAGNPHLITFCENAAAD